MYHHTHFENTHSFRGLSIGQRLKTHSYMNPIMTAIQFPKSDRFSEGVHFESEWNFFTHGIIDVEKQPSQPSFNDFSNYAVTMNFVYLEPLTYPLTYRDIFVLRQILQRHCNDNNVSIRQVFQCSGHSASDPSYDLYLWSQDFWRQFGYHRQYETPEPASGAPPAESQ